MGWNTGFDRIKEERKNLGFFKIFQSADLSSEHMRAFPYNFMSKISKKDFSYKMVIRAQWGKSWNVEVSKNTRYYYIEKRGWDQFVSDNSLGRNEFITFIHKGKMIFNVHIYEQNCMEILIPRNLLSMGSSSGIKREEGDCSYKDVKKEDEEIDESPGRVEIKIRKKKTEETKTSKKKMLNKKVKNGMERGESSRGVELKGMKKKAEASISSKKNRKSKSKINKKVIDGVPEFEITIKKSYLKFLAIPKQFVDDHLPQKSKMFTIRHPNGKSWKVLCLVREIRTIFSGGYSKLAREFPISVGDKCTFKLIDTFEFVLDIPKKTREEIPFMID
ncbi:PREDICTED: B3 domain-containing protein At3g17010-like [Camelina sativa]|uniref:B3 domain-containing protein At3g17010-like n=1 Tax=Camelina sativa TaxID=90675 RepID=A0ABM0YRM1_CAMSA|nr:PREDICTED: B3 domain-containing protein At3g17010-like [Camelina sativa]